MLASFHLSCFVKFLSSLLIFLLLFYHFAFYILDKRPLSYMYCKYFLHSMSFHLILLKMSFNKHMVLILLFQFSYFLSTNFCLFVIKAYLNSPTNSSVFSSENLYFYITFMSANNIF